MRQIWRSDACVETEINIIDILLHLGKMPLLERENKFILPLLILTRRRVADIFHRALLSRKSLKATLFKTHEHILAETGILPPF
jgi:hypothetical protein